nr:MAG TPA: Receptor Binding Protein sandwich domain, phage receptor [Bacteriophage sp.]
MANEISLVTYNESLVTPKHDAVIHDMAVENGILYGCKITVKDATTLHMTAGMGIVYGRQFELYESDITVPLSDTAAISGRLYVHVDLGNVDEPVQLLVETGASLGNLVDNPNINVENSATDMELATFEVTAETIGKLKMTYKSTQRNDERFAGFEEELSALNDRLKNKIMVEQITVKGIGESYFYIGDKTGYILMNVYNYAREYNTADVVKISHNVAQKIYYVFVEQVQPTTSSMALRLFWLATD